MGRLAPAFFAWALLGASPSLSAAQSQAEVWTRDAERVHERARGLYGRLVRARHEPERSLSERRCLDRVASRAGALSRILEHRASLGAIPPWAVADTEGQLDAIVRYAEERCGLIVEGEVEIDVWTDPFATRMRRDRATLRVGARFEMVPRVRRGGYALVPAVTTRGALGAFVLPWLRVEGTASFGWQPDYGPYGSVGARALLTAPWSLFRIAGGLAASVLLASDRLVNIEFGWLGVQIELPLEISWEISESFGLTLTGGPMYTQAGEVRASERAIGFSAGLLAEVVL